MYGAYCTLEMYSAYSTLEVYSAYSTLNYILCLWHLKEPCAYGTSKYIVHIALKK